MQKWFKVGVTMLCLAGALAGCGRNGSPTAPTRTETPTATPTPPPTPPVTVQVVSIGGDTSESCLMVGQTRQLKATAQFTDGTDYDITALANWSSVDLNVATVSTTGLVSALGAGTGRIRAVFQQISGTIAFEVAVAGLPSDGGTPTPPPGSPAPAPGPGVPNPPPPGSPAPAPGPGVPPSLPTVLSLTITGTTTVPAGRSVQLQVIATMSDGTRKDVTASADWSCENPLTARVTQSGLLTGILPGSNIVTVRYNGLRAQVPVEVLLL